MDELLKRLSIFGASGVIIDYTVPETIVLDFATVFKAIPRGSLLLCNNGERWALMSALNPISGISCLRVMYDLSHTYRIFMGG